MDHSPRVGDRRCNSQSVETKSTYSRKQERRARGLVAREYDFRIRENRTRNRVVTPENCRSTRHRTGRRSSRDYERQAIELVRRAHDALVRARGAALAEGRSLSEEFVLADLQEARAALGEVTGKRASDDVLTHIFERFCIGNRHVNRAAAEPAEGPKGFSALIAAMDRKDSST